MGAQKTGEAAQSAADRAQSKADSAQNRADDASQTADTAISSIKDVILIKIKNKPCPTGSEVCTVWRWSYYYNSDPYASDGYTPDADGTYFEKDGSWYTKLLGCCRYS